MANTVCQNCAKDSETLKAAIKQVPEHHFGNYSDCGSWCRVRDLEGTERKEADLKYREKITSDGKNIYDDARVIVDEFAGGADDMLHGWSTDIGVEGTNKFFTKFLPNDHTYGMTIENKVRIHLAICIVSVGYIETYRRLSDKIGVNLGRNHKDVKRLLDVRKLYMRKYRKRLVVRTKKKLNFFRSFGAAQRRWQKKPEELTIRIRHQRTIRGRLTNGWATNEDTNEDCTNRERQSRENGKTEYQCRHCAVWGHMRTSLKACLKNKNKKVWKALKVVAMGTREASAKVRMRWVSLGVSFYLGCDCRTKKILGTNLRVEYVEIADGISESGSEHDLPPEPEESEH
jgi:hypothetical protein